MKLRLHVSPRAYREREHVDVRDELAAGTCRTCPGMWRVLSCSEGPQLGIMRVFIYDLEPLDDVARTRAALSTPGIDGKAAR